MNIFVCFNFLFSFFNSKTRRYIIASKQCAKTYQNWAYEIKNSLEVPYSNGPIEGTNNKIKALKRVTFGMTTFENFKARIMLLN